MDVVNGFDPERWLHEDTKPRDYIPFGIAPRSCLGMNLALTDMKVFIATLARRVDFDLLGLKGENLEWASTSVIMKPDNGVPIRAYPHGYSVPKVGLTTKDFGSDAALQVKEHDLFNL